MKKLVLFLAVIAVLEAIPLHAVDISVGATTWYATWKMDDSVNITELGPEWFYGPMLAVKLNNDFAINSVFVYSTYNFDAGSDVIDWHRYDSDTSLSYRLNEYLKLFGGLKYLGYKIDIPGAPGEFNSFGPAAGLSAVIPVINNFFILGNVSGLYLRGKVTQEGEESTKYKVTGYNTSVSIAYYVEPASVSLNLGWRYQYYKMESFTSGDDPSMNRFYGITASATYSFSI